MLTWHRHELEHFHVQNSYFLLISKDAAGWAPNNCHQSFTLQISLLKSQQVLCTGQGACTKAPQAILARHDGCARAQAARLLADSAAHESDADLVAAEAERLTRSFRRILLQITLVKVRPAYSYNWS